MRNGDKKQLIKNALFITLVALIGVTAIIFCVLYIDTFSEGVVLEYSAVFIGVSVAIISILTFCTILFISLSKEFIYKLFFLTICLIAICLIGLYALETSGFLDKVGSVEGFREYIASFGSWAVILFTVIQFLQVVVLPIPSFITVGAGVLLFGPLEGAIYSCIGIILGSLVAFFLGRVFGYRVVKWLVGEESLNKGLKFIKGKDKIILTFMFLFPFFPDDVLCFVAGITTMNISFFVVMIIITRIITVFASSFSMNGSIIPYDTWWGILLWVLLFVATALITWFIYKNGDKIEAFFKRKKKSKDTKKD